MSRTSSVVTQHFNGKKRRTLRGCSTGVALSLFFLTACPSASSASSHPPLLFNTISVSCVSSFCFFLLLSLSHNDTFLTLSLSLPLRSLAGVKETVLPVRAVAPPSVLCVVVALAIGPLFSSQLPDRELWPSIVRFLTPSSLLAACLCVHR